MKVQELTLFLKRIEGLSQEHREITQKLHRLPEKVRMLKAIIQEEGSEVLRLQEELDTQQRNFDKVVFDIEDLETRQQKAEQRLSDITNQKEYQAAVKEVKAIEAQLSQRKEQKSLGQGRLSDLEKTVTECKTSLQNHQSDLKDHEEKIGQVVEQLKKRKTELAASVRELKKKLPETCQKIIVQLMKKNVFPYTGEANEDHVCQFCHLSYPAQLVVTAIREKTVIQCPSCFRILVPGAWAFEGTSQSTE